MNRPGAASSAELLGLHDWRSQTRQDSKREVHYFSISSKVLGGRYLGNFHAGNSLLPLRIRLLWYGYGYSYSYSYGCTGRRHIFLHSSSAYPPPPTVLIILVCPAKSPSRHGPPVSSSCDASIFVFRLCSGVTTKHTQLVIIFHSLRRGTRLFAGQGPFMDLRLLATGCAATAPWTFGLD
ncbi:hypothetical protein S40293_06472 [Stachybotrys chartarum IBT 40293]|nr:hypothetical protein S40293_06472 [Stachybotrys chartarum IBT 40293]